MVRLEQMSRGFAAAFSAQGRQRLAGKLASRLSAKVPPSLEQHHVLVSDIATRGTRLRSPSLRDPGAQLRIAWIIAPPHAGSGGHTTAFRMVQGLAEAGHRCELVLYDVFGGSIAAREAEIRRGWPELTVRVRSISDGLDGFDVCVATGWQTAYAMAARSADLDVHRCYFMQDFEPYFYPHGFEYALAEATYDLELHRIALGNMVTHRLAEHGASCETVPFGCDTDTYRLLGAGPRSGVVFYTRPGTSRRGFLLASLTLAEFHRRRPQVPIKVFGPAGRTEFDFPVQWQGRLSPQQLNELYNTSIAGLGMSFTNTSLVVGEMLAAGCVPVVNDSPDARLDVGSRFVRWGAPKHEELAEVLVELVDHPPRNTEEISASTNPNWRQTQREFCEVLTRIVTGAGA